LSPGEESKYTRGTATGIKIALGVLGLLVVITFSFYLARLSGIKCSDSSPQQAAGDQAYGQFNLELPPPLNISVTVDKGATIRWNAEEDARIIGYNVYRFTSPEDSGTKVNAAIISDNVYHDDDGTMFNSYAVACVDANGRQGTVSPAFAAAPEPSSLSGLTPTQKPQEVRDTVFGANPVEMGLPAYTVHCTGEGMAYQGVWYLEHYAEVTGGALMVTPYYGDSCTYTFLGESVTVISTRHWNYGIMDIYIDGELRQEVDLYASEYVVRDRVFAASGLGPGTHTIKLVCTGRKNPQAYFTFIDIEALEIR
jgi:hypothetical protein